MPPDKAIRLLAVDNVDSSYFGQKRQESHLIWAMESNLVLIDKQECLFSFFVDYDNVILLGCLGCAALGLRTALRILDSRREKFLMKR